MEATMKERSSLTPYNSSRINWQKEVYTESCIGEARIGTVWWKIGIWSLHGLGGTMNRGFAPYVAKKETEATY
jgi:hypothetical protein